MEPVTAAVAIKHIAKTVQAIKALIEAWQKYQQVLQKVKKFMQFLDMMKDVLTDQKVEHDVSDVRCRILQLISEECITVESTVKTFLKPNTFVRFFTGSSVTMAAALAASRVNLHEYWTMYHVSLALAGSSPVATMRLHVTSDHDDPRIAERLSNFFQNVAVIHSADADASKQQLLLLADQPKLTYAQEHELCRRMAEVRTAIEIPNDACTGTNVQNKHDNLNAHMAISSSRPPWGGRAATRCDRRKGAGGRTSTRHAPSDSSRPRLRTQPKPKAQQVSTAGATCTVQTLLRSSKLTCGNDRPGDTGKSSPPVSRTIDLAHADLSQQPAMHMVPKTVCEKDVQIESWELCAALESQRWDLQQAGTSLRDVTFTLPEHGGQLWVLNGNQGGNWQNVTIEGKGLSSMVVVGEMVLDNVTFEGCTLVATDNADLTATNCRFVNCQVAVMAAGAGASATFEGCTVKACKSGIVAANGAHVTIDAECKIACSGGSCCVMAHGEGASATVNGAALSYAAEQTSTCWCGGAAALCGGTISIEGFSSDHGVSSAHRSRATVHGTGEAGGVVACGRGSKIWLTACAVAAATVAVWAVHGGQVDAQKCRVLGSTTGLISSVAGSCVVATDCEVSGCKENCAEARQGGCLKLKQCSLKRSKEGNGVSADGRNSRVTLDACVVADNYLHGVHVTNSAVLDVWGQIDMQKSRVFFDNRLANVLATTRADVNCWECHISDNVTDHGMVADGWGTRVTAKNCMLTGNMQRGVVAQNQAFLEGVQLVVSGTAEAGVWVCSAATSELSEVTASECAHGSGVLAHGDKSSVTIEHSVVHGNSVGMNAQEGAKVTAKHVRTWRNASAGVVIDKFSTVLLESCTCQDARPYKTPWKGGGMTRRNCTPV